MDTIQRPSPTGETNCLHCLVCAVKVMKHYCNVGVNCLALITDRNNAALHRNNSTQSAMTRPKKNCTSFGYNEPTNQQTRVIQSGTWSIFFGPDPPTVWPDPTRPDPTNADDVLYHAPARLSNCHLGPTRLDPPTSRPYPTRGWARLVSNSGAITIPIAPDGVITLLTRKSCRRLDVRQKGVTSACLVFLR